MCGFQTTSQVLEAKLGNVIYSQSAPGYPLLPVDHLVLPDRAGVKFGVLGWLRLIIKALPHLPAFWASRPSVVDDRLAKVHSIGCSMVGILHEFH
jgi:hypothetical protein